MRVRPFETGDTESVAALVAAFRVEMARLRKRSAECDLQAAQRELDDYLSRGCHLFVAHAGGAAIGYIVCRTEGSIVWAEQLYVEPSHRRRGVAGALFAEAEKLAEKRGSDTVYNWVDPENSPIIAFLAKHGYDVLNLVEIRRPRSGETPAGKVRVGRHKFRR